MVPALRSRMSHWLCYKVSRGLRSYSTSPLIVNIPRSNVYRFGDSDAATPIFRDLSWTVRDGENCAVVGTGSGCKTAVLQMLMGYLRISPPPPPPGGLLPFLSATSQDPHESVSLVSFAHRPRASGGAFYDYTARYGAVREEDRITLRESMFSELVAPTSAFDTAKDAEETVDIQAFEHFVDKLRLRSLLDLPRFALSNGQTRRARIVKALLSKPQLLLLDEPFTGLDVQSRQTLSSVLCELHQSQNPRVIVGLRRQDPIPDWITHIVLVAEDNVKFGAKQEILDSDTMKKEATAEAPATVPSTLTSGSKVLVDMKNVNVAYSGHQRKVLEGIDWTIRSGDRWHLQGANGSGKTTLLALITGDHPQSYTQRALTLLGRPRPRTPTAHLRANIGVVSPELANAFPRRASMSVWDAVGTGFDGGFMPLGPHSVGVGDGGLSEEQVQWRVGRVREVLQRLGPRSWGAQTGPDVDEGFAKRAFVDLSGGEQSMVLLMRALVGRPPLVILDEVWSGMDDAMVCAARAYLRDGAFTAEQAVIVVSHWEEEVPWSTADGVQRYLLDGGRGVVVQS